MNLTIVPDGRGYVLETSLRVSHPVEKVFAVFADAFNLEALTPPSLRFEILTAEPIVMRPGLLLDYRLSLHGVPIRWQSEITVWDPPHRFVDEQRRGPYLWWIHEHRFSEENGQTVMSDQVKYGVPGGELVHRLVVARDLREIFTYRAAHFRKLLEQPESA